MLKIAWMEQIKLWENAEKKSATLSDSVCVAPSRRNSLKKGE